MENAKCVSNLYQFYMCVCVWGGGGIAGTVLLQEVFSLLVEVHSICLKSSISFIMYTDNMDGWMDGWMEEWMDRWVDGGKEKWVEGRMDG